MTIKVNGAGLLRVMNQTNNITGASALKALLLRSGHSAGTESAATIAAYTTLNECRDTSYAQQTLSGVSGTVISGGMKVVASDMSFSNAGSHPGDSITGGLIAINLGGSSSANIPLVYADLDSAKSLSGTTQPIFPHGYGLFDISTAATTHKIYPAGLAAVVNNTVTLATSGNVYARLLMTTTSALGEEPSTLAGFTTLGECDAASYARQTVSGLTWSNPTGYVMATCSTLTFPNSGASTAACRYLLFCLKVGASPATSDIPLALQRLDSDKTLSGVALPLYEPTLGFLKLAI